ncbi:DUF6584 family protein [Streptomyces sp. DT24]|uniref:DUF6584 family protein n=1 Tax=unclassified Streptomyces TaxID=2593676 RepID=UPI003CFA0AAF
MAPTETLARVDADLAAGRVPVARQRLRGLVSSFPTDLTLRRRLAEVYRLYGDEAEAGRWTYLDEDRAPEEVAAFEARYRTPVRRMRALAWRGPEALAESAFAAGQLAAVRAECAEAVGRPVDWDSVPEADDDRAHKSLGENLAGLGCMVAVFGLLAIWVFGLLTLLDVVGLFELFG